MANVTLITPPGLKSFSGLQMHTPNPPLGLAYIVAAVRKAGYRCNVIDTVGEALDQVSPYSDRTDLMVQGLSTEQVIERIPADSGIIGFSCNFSTLWPMTRQMIGAIRERFPEVLIVLGGEHGTAVSENVLRTSDIDVVVLGEGEEVLIRVIEAMDNGESFDGIQGISFRKGDEVVNNGLAPRVLDIDDIAPPDWDSLPINEYISHHQINGVNVGRSMPLLATRGCPYECTFCSNPDMWTRRYITRSPKLIVDEMESYIRKYRVKNFDFQDLTAIINRRWAKEFCEEIISRNLEITWQMPSGTRSEVFDEEIAELLVRAGCYALAFAPESGSPEILEDVRKQVDLDNVVEAMRVTLKQDMKLSSFFVIGFPNETRETLRQTLSFIRKIALIGVYDVSVTKFVPYPGSALFKQLQRDGLITLDDEFFISPMDFYSRKSESFATAISSRHLYWMMIWMYVNFYVLSFLRRPLRTFIILSKSIISGTEETRYAKWLVDQLYTRRKWKRIGNQA